MGLGAAIKSKLGGLILPFLLERAKSELESTEEGRSIMQKVWKFFDGKKTYTAIVMAAWPGIVAAAVAGAQKAGVDPAQVAHIAAIGGPTVLFVIGIVHKVVKWLDDQTPDAPSQS